MTWLWQPLLPGGAKLLAGGGGGTIESGAFSSDGVATVSAVGAFTATVSGVFSAEGAATVSGISPQLGGPLPTGSNNRRRTLPYGWWETEQEAKDDLREAERIVSQAKAEVKGLGEVRESTADQLRNALWFADIDSKIDALARAISKSKANQEIRDITAALSKAKAEYERRIREIEDEQDEEEAITLLLLSN